MTFSQKPVEPLNDVFTYTSCQVFVLNQTKDCVSDAHPPMIDAKEAIDRVNFLLLSAKNRSTEQGILVYEKIPEMLGMAHDDAKVREVLTLLNRSLAVIEAHGDFTEDEFRTVLKIRSMLGNDQQSNWTRCPTGYSFRPLRFG
jgi:hypothetical protein